MNPGVLHPHADRKGMFAFLVAPVGLEQMAAAALPNEMQNFGSVVGQVDFDGEVRLRDLGQVCGDVFLFLGFAPRNVFERIPTPS